MDETCLVKASQACLGWFTNTKTIEIESKSLSSLFQSGNTKDPLRQTKADAISWDF